MTARDDIASKEKGFHTGVDDYMVKPIDSKNWVPQRPVGASGAHIDDEKRAVRRESGDERRRDDGSVEDEEITLPTREFNILFKLLSYPKQVFSRAQLMDEFWDTDSYTGLRAVDVYITNLRKKLAACDGFDIGRSEVWATRRCRDELGYAQAAAGG
jgi:two-component system, OmpR family, response regulator